MKTFALGLFLLCTLPLAASELPKGIAYHNFVLKDENAVHMLEVDPHLVDLVPAKSDGFRLETVASIAERHGAVAAVNAGFFLKDGPLGYLPAGILKIHDRWYATPIKPRGAIGWSNDGSKPLFDQVLTTTTVQVGRRSLTIDGINRMRGKEQVMLYNPLFARSTHTSKDGVELIIQNGRITRVWDGNSPIARSGYVLSAGPRKKHLFHSLKPGHPFSWVITMLPVSSPPYTAPADWEKVSYVVGGTPILVRNGEIVTDFSSERTRQDFLDDRHPRTAVGLLPNGHVVFVVIDGRGESPGMTMLELATFMHKIGCVEALNLDGGGSTTMVVNQQVVNTPSGEEDDGAGHKVRPVSDAILMLPKPEVYN